MSLFWWCIVTNLKSFNIDSTIITHLRCLYYNVYLNCSFHHELIFFALREHQIWINFNHEFNWNGLSYKPISSIQTIVAVSRLLIEKLTLWTKCIHEGNLFQESAMILCIICLPKNVHMCRLKILQASITR